MTAQAILPRRADDPTGQDKRERGAMAQMQRRFRGIRKGMLAILAQQQYETVEVNQVEQNALILNWALEDGLDEHGTSDLVEQYNAREYRFLLDENVLSRINLEIDSLVDSWLLEGGPSNLWLYNQYVWGAFEQGTALAHANLAVQSGVYKAAKPDLQSILISEPYQRRIGLVRARVFEEMKGLTDWAKGDLGSTLARGMTAGLNPRKIAKQIDQRIGVGTSRAERIARTEITSALKTARLQEDETAAELGVLTRQMQFSALSPTTRPDHKARHGQIYTAAEVKAWRNRDANDINCKCSFIAVVVDENGRPYNDAVIKKARGMLTKESPS